MSVSQEMGTATPAFLFHIILDKELPLYPDGMYPVSFKAFLGPLLRNINDVGRIKVFVRRVDSFPGPIELVQSIASDARRVC